MSGCFECGKPAQHDHHVVPKSRGGTKIVPLCEDCHGKAHERVMRISALTRDAMSARKAAGKRVGSIPYGWGLSEDGVSLERNETEQEMISLAKKWRGEGWTLRQIADGLWNVGYANRRGAEFDPNTIFKIVGRKFA